MIRSGAIVSHWQPAFDAMDGPEPTTPATEQAIRRRLTILNCDLVDSTRYADLLDPEAFLVLLRQFFVRSAEVVQRSAGTMVQNTGDGFVVNFGFPRTHRASSVNAVNCALALAEMMRSDPILLEHKLQARFGVATGDVVLSSFHQGGLFNNIPFGSAAHRAARVQSLAEPGGVWVDETTHALAVQQFSFTDQGEQELKGFTESSPVYRVDGRTDHETTFLEFADKLAPMVGRVQEIELLNERWDQTKDSEGQTILLSGEPGLGKSRIIHEFREGIRPDNALEVVLQCEEGFENTTLHPWLRYFERAADIVQNDSVLTKHQKVGATIRSVLGLNDELLDFALSLTPYALDKRALQHPPQTDDIRPELRLEALRAAIAQYVLNLAQSHPLLIVVEDLQWIDPTSRQVIESLVEHTERMTAMMVLSHRADFPVYLAHGHVTSLSLSRLRRAQVADLVRGVIGNLEVPDHSVTQIIERAEGNPLFIEELARSLRTLVEKDDDRPWLTDIQNDDALPDKLQSLLETRLDALGEEEKILAGAASVIGREFQTNLLAQLVERNRQDVEAGLTALMDAGVVSYRVGEARDACSFKHALLHEAAYANLLHTEAIRYHSRLISLLRSSNENIEVTSPEILARHLTRSDQYAEAAEMWYLAGQSARDTGSNLEALGRLDYGLHNVLPHLRQVEPRLQMRYQLARGEVINAHFGPRADAKAALEDAANIATRLQDANAISDTHSQLFHLRYVLADFPQALGAAQLLIDQSGLRSHHGVNAMGYLGAGMCRFAVGEFEKAQDHLHQVLHIARQYPQQARDYASKAQIYLAFTTYILGDESRAEELCEEGVTDAREQSAPILAAALGNSLYLYHVRSQVERALEVSTELLELTERKGLMMWYYQAQFWHGWALAAKGDRDGLRLMEESMIRFDEASEVVELSIFYCALSKAYLGFNEVDDAIQRVDAALKLVEEFGERFFQAPLLFQKAHCLTAAKVADPTDIERLRAQAQALAQHQNAKAPQWAYEVVPTS